MTYPMTWGILQLIAILACQSYKFFINEFCTNYNEKFLLTPEFGFDYVFLHLFSILKLNSYLFLNISIA